MFQKGNFNRPKWRPCGPSISRTPSSRFTAPPLSQDLVMPHANNPSQYAPGVRSLEILIFLEASDSPCSRQLSRPECPDAVCFRGLDQSLQESTPNSAPACGNRNVDSNFGNARVTRSLGYWTQRSPSKHSLVSRH